MNNNQKATKRALLTSVMALVMCVVMLVGTTFAWFTDTASTGVNKIVSGNLKVDIIGENSDSHIETLNFTKAGTVVGTDAAAAILWEPGCRYLTEGFKIANKGNLALKWKAEINKDNVVNDKVAGSTIAKDGKSLLDVIDFYVVTKAADGTETAVAIENFTGKLAANVGKSETYYIKGVMQTTAGNDYQDLTLDGITITVYATQDTVENDSFNNQYDAGAPLDFVPVSTAAELKSVFANAAAGEDVNVSLTGDIDLGADKTLMIVDENSNVGDINIQANGHTVKNAVAGARVLQMAKSNTVRTITITGAKIVSEGAVTRDENRGVQIFSVDNATVNLVNCDIEMTANDYSYPVKIGGTSKNTTVNITGCTLTGANCIESFGTNCTVNITDCVLNSNYAPNATYCGNGIQDKNGTNNTYNIKNTTFNGTNAQPWQTSSTTVINDLGGNVYNTTRTTA